VPCPRSAHHETITDVSRLAQRAPLRFREGAQTIGHVAVEPATSTRNTLLLGWHYNRTSGRNTMRESRKNVSRHRRSKPPRQSLRYPYRIDWPLWKALVDHAGRRR
jgi:hypothetical protein